MMKLKSKRFCRGNFKFGRDSSNSSTSNKGAAQSNKLAFEGNGSSNSCGGDIKWELRPGGMLVQKRDQSAGKDGQCLITVRVSTVCKWHHISIQPTSTFGELKLMLAMVTNLEPKEQRVLFKGKERDDCEFLHMVGVQDKDKVLLLEDPAIKEMKLLGLAGNTAYRTISV